MVKKIAFSAWLLSAVSFQFRVFLLFSLSSIYPNQFNPQSKPNKFSFHENFSRLHFVHSELHVYCTYTFWNKWINKGERERRRCRRNRINFINCFTICVCVSFSYCSCLDWNGNVQTTEILIKMQEQSI